MHLFPMLPPRRSIVLSCFPPNSLTTKSHPGVISIAGDIIDMCLNMINRNAIAAILNCGYIDFSTTSICSKLKLQYSTKFGNDWLTSKQMTTVSEIQDGGGRHFELWLLRFFDVADVFEIKVAIFLLTLVMIGQIVKKWQLFFEI